MLYLLDSNVWIENLKALTKRGRCVIYPMDFQNAQFHGLTVITGNAEKFRRVHGLKVEDWSV